MATLIDLTGQRFGRLVVVARAENTVRGTARWSCACDCGGGVTVEATSLRYGYTKSCGCLRRESNAVRNMTHGMSWSPEHRSWRNAKRRCFDTKHRQYANYGGRGITMCAEWVNDFAAFYAHIGPRPDGHSLDRIDNDGNYEPGNVRWADRSTQNKNQRPRK